MEIDARAFEPFLNRFLNLTDQASQAHISGHELDYRRVQADFESLLSTVREQCVLIDGQSVPIEDFAKFLNAICHAPRQAARLGSQKAFEGVAEAAKPLTPEGVALSTARRPVSAIR